jgi:hypothetical protein
MISFPIFTRRLTGATELDRFLWLIHLRHLTEFLFCCLQMKSLKAEDTYVRIFENSLETFLELCSGEFNDIVPKSFP